MGVEDLTNLLPSLFDGIDREAGAEKSKLKVRTKKVHLPDSKKRKMDIYYLVLDSEYILADKPAQKHVVYTLPNGIDVGTTLEYIPYKYRMWGLYDPQTNTYSAFWDFEELMQYLQVLSLKYRHIHIVSFYNYAEISTFDWNVLKKYFRYTPFEIRDIGKSLLLKLWLIVDERSGKVIPTAEVGGSNYVLHEIVFKDLMKITSAESLSKLAKAFGVSVKSSMTGADVSEFHFTTPEGRAILEAYNREDCIATWELFEKFMAEIDALFESFGVDPLSSYEKAYVFTLGRISQLLLLRLQEKYNEKFMSLEWLAKEFREKIGISEKFVGDELPEDPENAETEIEFYEIEGLGAEEIQFVDFLKGLRDRSTYKGGGLIHNFSQLYQAGGVQFENCYVYDFFSLYPVSLLILSQNLPADLKIKRYEGKDLGYLERKGYRWLAKVKFKRLKGLPVLSVKIEQGEPQPDGYEVDVKIGLINTVGSTQPLYRLVYCDEGETWISDWEYRELKGWYTFEPSEVYYWKPSRVNCLFDLTFTLLQRRLSEVDETKKYVLKMLLNILYGKIAERRLTKISNYLVATLLTSVSRAIVYRALRQITVPVLQTATDSLFTIGAIPAEEIQRVLVPFEKYLHGLITPEKFLKLEVEAHTLYLFRNKLYALVDPQTGEVSKFAVHGIQARKNREGKEVIEKLVQAYKSGNTAPVLKYTAERTWRVSDLFYKAFLFQKKVLRVAKEYGIHISTLPKVFYSTLVLNQDSMETTIEDSFIAVFVLKALELVEVVGCSYMRTSIYLPFYDTKLKLDSYVLGRATEARPFKTVREYAVAYKQIAKQKNALKRKIKRTQAV